MLGFEVGVYFEAVGWQLYVYCFGGNVGCCARFHVVVPYSPCLPLCGEGSLSIGSFVGEVANHYHVLLLPKEERVITPVPQVSVEVELNGSDGFPHMEQGGVGIVQFFPFRII